MKNLVEKSRARDHLKQAGEASRNVGVPSKPLSFSLDDHAPAKASSGDRETAPADPRSTLRAAREPVRRKPLKSAASDDPFSTIRNDPAFPSALEESGAPKSETKKSAEVRR